jgi:pyruvate/2-oxoacid:ferredoxin oxidoreductase beta subunit
MQIVAAHAIPYAATASVGYIDDLGRKVTKAKLTDGPAFLHIHAPCPTGWGYDPSQTIQWAKLAVASRCWNLYEIVDGIQVTITKKVKNVKPVQDYLKPQKRFKDLDADTLALIQGQIEKEYGQLERLAHKACGEDNPTVA